MKSKRKPQSNRAVRCSAVVSLLKFLREKEWTMGNGQCHECCGKAPRQRWWTETVGHRKDCKLAKSIESLGGKVAWEHFNHSKKRREHLRWWSKTWEQANAPHERPQD